MSGVRSSRPLQMVAPANVTGRRLDDMQRSWMISAGIWNVQTDEPMGPCTCERRADGTRLLTYIGPGPLRVRRQSL